MLLLCRCIAGTSLQEALAQALLCPLLEPGGAAESWQVPEKGEGWRPVWQANTAGATENVENQLYSIRRNGGRNFIVRRPHPYYKVDRWNTFPSTPSKPLRTRRHSLMICNVV